MKIDKYIDTLNFADKLSELNNLLINAQGDVSFWGARVITVSGYEGSLSLDKIARKVLQAGGKRSDSDDLTTEERIAGIEITEKLRNYYKITDNKITKANWFTRLINLIREFTLFSYTPRFHTEPMGSTERYFRGYSEEKFVQEFGDSENSLGEYSNSDGLFRHPCFDGLLFGHQRRIMAREECIREKLSNQ